MGLQIPFSTSFNLPDGRVVTLETGKLGTQADGSAVVRCGVTILFASVKLADCFMFVDEAPIRRL